ncbi:methyl-accepting chemotaxis protein [Desulfurivibrio alkaliphilus]|uniref:Methyl-accepting chemotaxis sensory transducer n=1 Tax=Desulfurivibrio alkaliphilus (strain DSM 19089 / UNIQEM U267 / AHT2) TaxID=589865 RepID=D6Z1A9_DESAT|nr:methyl-accepting chemotaxis protein [Desulfurivibrio alkaliphilus]ADH85364.1 methyl-accepting chemotaxis sensory transducer [Desulfurivibrio alkaliphilus AHT 2]
MSKPSKFNLSLKQKMMLPLLVAVLISALLAMPLVQRELGRLSSGFIANVVSDKQEEIDRAIDRAAADALEKAAVFTRLPEVLEAYELAHQGDINAEDDPHAQQARELLRRELGEAVAGYDAIVGEPMQLHFHLPSGRSLVRLWRERQVQRNGTWVDISDDISTFRPTVMEVNRSGRPVQGIEVGQGGFVIRGVAPIRSPGGRQLGSVEMLADFDQLFQAAVGAGQQLLLYMNADLLSVAGRLRDAQQYPLVDNRYVLVSGSDDGRVEQLIDLELLQTGARGMVMRQADARMLAAFPVNDYQGNQIGIMVLAQDTSAVAAGIRNVLVILGLVAGLIMLLIVAINFLTARAITNPIQQTVTMIREMAKGRLDSRLHMTRTDEIGVMAKTMDEFADTLQNQVVAGLQKLAQGDLTFEAQAHDEQDVIGNALVKTNADLNRTVGEILSATEQIAAGANQVSSASQSLSQGATESAASLEEITSSMTEMASQTKLNAENSTQANQLAGEARQAAESGNEQMEKMMAAMTEINEAGQNISKIIKVIDEIAFQTNLLALNAAVEAARAGRHGKGFAVVAEEVRNLAARSAKAAKETAELIEGSVAKTENGTEIATQTSESLKKIVRVITKATDLVGEIAAASNEQAQGISQVNEGLSQIDQVTQTNTANAEEGAAAAEELSSQANHLRGLMGVFTIKGGQPSRRRQALPEAPEYRPEPGDQGSFKGWDSVEPKAGRGKKASEVIALDDHEFGRY